MKRVVNKFGKLITASFFVMGIGVIAFLLTPLLYGRWGIDSDLPGVLLVDIGLIIFVVGMIRRKQLHGLKLAGFAILAAVLSIPIFILIGTTIYYLITGRPAGS